MDTWRRDKSVKEKTFYASRSMGPSYTQSQMVPYSDATLDNITHFDSRLPKMARSKSMAPRRLANPDLQRQRRVASYKVYTAEGKVKSSLHRSFRWMKDKYLELRYGLI